MGTALGWDWGWDGTRDGLGMMGGMGWERGQGRGAVFPVAGAPHAVGEPRGVLGFPAAKGPEQEVSPLRTRGGNESRPKPTATGHTTPAVSAPTAKMQELGGGQQHPSLSVLAGNRGCPRRGAHPGERGSFSTPLLKAASQELSFMVCY